MKYAGPRETALNRVGRMAPPLACTVLNLCHSYSFAGCTEARVKEREREREKTAREKLREAAHAFV